MREIPILFSAPMVRAILDGRKTVTRRIVKPQPDIVFDGIVGRFTPDDQRLGRLGETIRCPYGQAGDRLWVRETFKEIASGEVKQGYGEVRYGFAYQADAATRWASQPTIIHDLRDQPPTGPMQFQPRPWKPSIHMPKRASRITLEVTGVRVERLHEIDHDDALREGVCGQGWKVSDQARPIQYPVDEFRDLWQSINGAISWDDNPWVWVVAFRRIEQEKKAA
jgi:hypothetical protein